jgi:hypothetical protein
MDELWGKPGIASVASCTHEHLMQPLRQIFTWSVALNIFSATLSNASFPIRDNLPEN